MILQKMEEFGQLSLTQKGEVLINLAVYPALTVMVWMRQDIGARLLAPRAGVMCFFLFVACAFVTGPLDRQCLFGFTVLTLLLSMWQRIKRWREFRRGVKQHSYYLGSGYVEPKGFFAFLYRNRRGERFIQPYAVMAAGYGLVTINLPVTGWWIGFSGFCLAMVEGRTRWQHREDDMDMVDGMVRSEIQSGTVEQFSEPAQVTRPTTTSIPTGLGDDIRHKIRRK